jgi:hypothetical protein
MTGLRREYFLRLWEFVIGLAAAEMYALAMAFLNGDAHGVRDSRQIENKIAEWTSEGFQLRVGLNVPYS